MHNYLVELRIISDHLEEKDISRRLGLHASRFVAKGEMDFQKVASQSVWQFDARPTTNTLEWSSLEDGLVFLLNKLIPVEAALDELRATCDVTICCGHFYSGFGGGPTLSPVVLKLLGEVGVKITISNYWANETDENGQSGHSSIESPVTGAREK